MCIVWLYKLYMMIGCILFSYYLCLINAFGYHVRSKDYERMIAAEVHIGTKNMNFGMRDYVFKRRDDST